MSWIAAAIAGSAIVGGVVTSNASKNAANAQVQASDNASQTQLAMFNQNKADLAPWMRGGGQGLNALMGYLGVGANGFDPNAPGVRQFGMSDFQADPGYGFRMQQGQNAIMNQRSAMGGVLSGGTLRDLTSFGQGMGAQEYQSAYNRFTNNQDRVYNRLAGLSNTGVNAAGGIANLGASAASQIGANQIGAGNATAAGIVGSANGISNAASGAVNNWLLANMLQQNGGGIMNTPGRASPLGSGMQVPFSDSFLP